MNTTIRTMMAVAAFALASGNAHALTETQTSDARITGHLLAVAFTRTTPEAIDRDGGTDASLRRAAAYFAQLECTDGQDMHDFVELALKVAREELKSLGLIK
jgi:hypothetical protein